MNDAHAMTHDEIETRFFKCIRSLKICSKRDARTAARIAAKDAVIIVRRFPSVRKVRLEVFSTAFGVTIGLSYDRSALTAAERDISETMIRENRARFAQEYGKVS